MAAVLVLSYPNTHPRIRILEGNQINNLDGMFDAYVCIICMYKTHNDLK